MYVGPSFFRASSCAAPDSPCPVYLQDDRNSPIYGRPEERSTFFNHPLPPTRAVPINSESCKSVFFCCVCCLQFFIVLATQLLLLMLIPGASVRPAPVLIIYPMCEERHKLSRRDGPRTPKSNRKRIEVKQQ